MPIFRTVCSWCSRVLNEEPCTDVMIQLALENDTEVIVSHGICPVCRNKIEQNEFPAQGGEHHVGMD